MLVYWLANRLIFGRASLQTGRLEVVQTWQAHPVVFYNPHLRTL